MTDATILVHVCHALPCFFCAGTPSGSHAQHIHYPETQWTKPEELQAQETEAAARSETEAATATSAKAASTEQEASEEEPKEAAPVVGGWMRVESAPVLSEADKEKQTRLKVCGASQPRLLFYACPFFSSHNFSSIPSRLSLGGE